MLEDSPLCVFAEARGRVAGRFNYEPGVEADQKGGCGESEVGGGVGVGWGLGLAGERKFGATDGKI